MTRKQSVSVCACCTPCSYLSILRCNHVPAPEVLPTHLYWVGTRQITENLFCVEFWDGISNAQMRILEKGPSPTKFIVPPPPPVPNSWPAWQSTPSQPNRAAGGKITFDLTARGVKAEAALVPLSGRNGVNAVGTNYLAAYPPTGSELSHYVEAKICDEQISARLNIDVLPYLHGAELLRNEGGVPYALYFTSVLFQNAHWSIEGNHIYSRPAEWLGAVLSNDWEVLRETTDYFVQRFRLSLGETDRLMQHSDKGWATTAVRLVALIDEDAVVGTKNTVLATAHTFRGQFGLHIDSFPELWLVEGADRLGNVGPIWSPSRSVHAVGSFSDVGIAGINSSTVDGFGGTLKVFRDGEFVSQFANITIFTPPSQLAGIQQSTNQEGVYLLQYEPNNDSGQPPIQLGSFVVDQTPPLVVLAQRNDMYVGDASESFKAFPKQRGAACSEPSDSFNSVYGSIFPYNGEEFAFFDPMPPDAGIYSWAAEGSVYDRAGNLCRHNPQLRLTVHAVPPDGKFGAHAQIELPFIGDDYVGVSVAGLDVATSEFRFGRITTPSRALLYANPVTQFVVRFDKPVRGLTRDHITLERWGEPDWTATPMPSSGITVTQRSPTEWLVSFYTEHRNCVWYAKVDPAGGNVTVIGDGDDESEEERCRLAARSMWAVLPQRPVMEPINCQPERMLVGGVSSITEEVEIDVNGRPDTVAAEGSNPGRGYRDITLSSSREMYLPSSAGEFTADKTRKSFIPNVPASRFNGSGITGAHSYFGLPTTIYPSPPALVEPCAAPSVPQKHSSVICSTNEILNWTITRQGMPFSSPIWPTSLSFSSTYRGYDCQQNVWADDNYHAFLCAARNVSVHRPLKTAFLHRLTIVVSGFFEDVDKDNGQCQLIPFYIGPLQFSTEEEETLANGGTVTRPENSWTISFRAS